MVGALIAALIQSCISSIDRTTATPAALDPNCRMVRHALGVTCVPTQPQRVITLSVPSLGNALALGVTPVASIIYSDNPPEYLAQHLDSIQILGNQEQPSLEKIASLKPDLIIGLKYSIQPIYSQLTRIAPTVADHWTGYSSWRRHFDFVTIVLGRTDLAQQVWRRYYQRIESLKATLQKSGHYPEVSFAHTCCGTIDVDVVNSFNGSIMADVGIRRPTLQAVPVDGGLVRLSRERLMDIDGDVLFVAANGPEAAQTITKLKHNPLWQELRAVQSGHVYPVHYPTWRGGNPLAADAVIDDLFTYLTNPESPS
ncbi:iron-siderophore ABC transporter substrate-binding protein [Cyanobium sp. CH-040]|uniref:iron-siderophore ABC transporter substrate-binding protein n=1 Tax=Cyanobium sp. CH-040 TaxID=2823708 RepID=UPI0020CC5D26|nr:iron-siderophore ABC transporter substrate-binding protein [Cyanobium sp. CH-040]MCP9928793.1 iron-siderophore ABC transporter substrate-binding protein [Cyanobium sp. CH-040]